MTALTLLLSLCAQPVEPPAVQFGQLTPAQARQLAGAVVRVEFRVGRPAYTWRGPLRTVTGPAEVEGDDQERTAVLRGDRVADLREGKRVRAVGTVRVIRHAAAQVNGVVVPEWEEVRFEER